MVPEVVGEGLSGVQQLGHPGVGDVAGHDQGPGQGQPGLDRVLRQLVADGVHGLVEVDGHHGGRQVLVGDLG